MPVSQNQNTEDQYPREIDFEPDPEPFDQEQVTREIWEAIHPS